MRFAAGRVLVNGQPATKGQAVEARDRISVDGRLVRLRAAEEVSHRAMLYHRAADEPLRPDVDRTATSSIERLPKVRGRRWLAVSPLSPADGGLELFLTDGALAAALNRRAPEFTMEYSLRLRGGFDEARVFFSSMSQSAADSSTRVLNESCRNCAPPE